MNSLLSVVILTYNEEKNLEVCLKSVIGLTSNIFIVDSFSSDQTLEIAKRYTKYAYQRKFIAHSEQLNWVLENLPIETPWVMRLDADEYITKDLADEITVFLPNVSQEVFGLYIKRRVIFMERWMKHGGYYPIELLRIWRKGAALLENIVSVDQHIVLRQGKKALLKHDIVDKNNKDLLWWIDKHNAYSTREAIYSICVKYKIGKFEEIHSSILGTQEERKRFLKSNLYMHMPLFIRAVIYFLYRYILRLGFLDRAEGLCWHFLQGLWYRFLVDAKIYEINRKIKLYNLSLKQIIEKYVF